MKLIKKVTFIIIFLFININAFGGVSSFVDDIDVPANGDNGQNQPTGAVSYTHLTLPTKRIV